MPFARKPKKIKSLNRKRHQFSIEYKLKAIAKWRELNENTSQAARHPDVNVDRQTLKGWIFNEESYRSMSNKKVAKRLRKKTIRNNADCYVLWRSREESMPDLYLKIYLKMVRKCCVTGCHGNYDEKNKVRVFRLPKVQDERERWLKLISRDNTPQHPDTVVCERHFPSGYATVVVRGKIRPKDPPSVFNLPLNVLPSPPPKPRTTEKTSIKYLKIYLKMVKKCCVTGCRGNYNKKNKVRVFRLPKDQDERKRWLKLISRDNTPQHPDTVVCERHFPSGYATMVVWGKVRPKDPPSVFNLPLNVLPSPPPKPRTTEKTSIKYLKIYLKMVKRCCVTGCRGNYNKKNKVRVFRLPKDQDERERWLKLISRDNTPQHPDTVVCERHFPSGYATVVVWGKVRPKDPPSVFNLPLNVLPSPPPKPRTTEKTYIKYLKIYLKMVKMCCVTGCRGNYDKKNKVRVFRLPKDQDERKRWLKLISRDNTPQHPDTVVCERHFPSGYATVVFCGKVRPKDPPSVFNLPLNVLPSPPPKPRTTEKTSIKHEPSHEGPSKQGYAVKQETTRSIRNVSATVPSLSQHETTRSIRNASATVPSLSQHETTRSIRNASATVPSLSQHETTRSIRNASATVPSLSQQETTRSIRNASATVPSLSQHDSLSQPTAAKLQKKTGRRFENQYFEKKQQKAMTHSVQPSLSARTQMQLQQQHLQVAAPPPTPVQPAPRKMKVLAPAVPVTVAKPKPVEKPRPREKRIFVVANHQRCVMANLASLWKSGKLCDAGIGNGSATIMVHKLVLSAVCPKLMSVFNTDILSHEFLQVNFPGKVSTEALNAFAEYMYNGILDLDRDILEQLKIIAKRLDMNEFEQLCDSHLPNHMHQAASAAAATSFTNVPLIQTTMPVHAMTSSLASLGSAVSTSMQSAPSITTQLIDIKQEITEAELAQIKKDTAAVFGQQSVVAPLAPNKSGNAAGFVISPSIKMEPVGPEEYKYGHLSSSSSNQAVISTTSSSLSSSVTASASTSVASVPASSTEFAIPFSEAADVKSSKLKAKLKAKVKAIQFYKASLVSDLSPVSSIVETVCSQSSSMNEDFSKPLRQPSDSLPMTSNSNNVVYPVRLFTARGDNIPLLPTHSSDAMTVNSFIPSEKT